MATTPLFTGPDGTLRETFIFTTQRADRFFTGQIAENTIDMQVSIRGGAFTSDPDFITFEGTSFTIPNPQAYPDGLDLDAGLNIIEARAVDETGSVSSSGRVEVTLIQDSDVGLIVSPPTRITLERLDDAVEVTIQGVSDSRVRGYNFYASASPGGGADGYSLINVNLVTEGEDTIEETALGTLRVDANLKTDGDNLAADPLLYSFVGTQRDSEGTLLQTDFNELVEVPETARQVRSEVTLSTLETVSFFSFLHNRSFGPNSSPATISNGAFSATAGDQPLYYVVTAVYYDEARRVEVESTFSEEVSGQPLIVRPVVGSFPVVRREQIVNDVSLSIFRTRPEIDIKPGSVPRDVFIDPFSQEAVRLRFILDFLHRAQSFSALLRIDDPSSTGTSIPVGQSPYKQSLRQAFNLVQDTDVQAIIDQAFEKLASNFGVERLPGRKARTEVIFFTRRRPTASITIPIGSVVGAGGANFRTTRAAQITIENIASFFSPQTGRYSVRVAVEALSVGTQGNVGIGQIQTIVRGPSGLSVTNDARAFGGKNQETNSELAVRAQGRLASVDSGTYQGYRRAAIGVSGVQQVSLVVPGDDLMQRDFGTDGQHKGGKVDIWVLGTQLNRVSDSFAFSFRIARDVQFEVFGNPNDLVFRAVSPEVSETSPIIEMLDIDEFGYGFRNDSTGQFFDLTDVQILSYNTIQLSADVNQPTVSLLDLLRGDIRFRESNRYVFPRQPATFVASLTGEVTGTVGINSFALYENSSPLQSGRSSGAGDYLQLIDDGSTTIPSAQPLTVTDETVVILGEYPEYLGRLGVNPLTIRVYSEDRTIQYVSPFDPAGSPDYTILDPTDLTTPVAIQRTETGNITSGETLSIDYAYDENFTVAYDTDFLVTAVQDTIDSMKHLTADVLVKRSVPVPIDITATIVLNRGSDPAVVRSRIQTNLVNYIGGLGLGGRLRRSDAIGVVEATEGVSYVVVPLTKMVRAENSLVVREALTTDQASDAVLIPAWSTDAGQVYLLTDPLANATTTGGGPSNLFRGVFQTDIELELQIVSPDRLGEGSRRAFIVGSGGLSIPGYSDDATLTSAGFSTDSTREEERIRLTANRVLVSLGLGETPQDYDYSATYIVGEDSGDKNIEPGPVEYPTLGLLDLTFDEDR